MRKLLALAGLLFLSAVSVYAQSVVIPGNPILNSTGAPTGLCSSYNLDVITSTGALYTCAAGSWTVVSGGGGAVSSVFTRTGAVVAVSGDYTLDQIGNPAAQKSFALGTNNPLNITDAGVFSNTQQNEYFQSLINGCSPATEFAAMFSGNFATDGLAGCVATPASGNVLQTNGVAGYVNSLSTTINAVGVLGIARCLATGCSIWGDNPVAVDNGFAVTQMYGSEVDINVFNALSSGQAIRIAGAWSAQPTQSNSSQGNMPGILIVKPQAASGGPFFWTAGLACGTASTNNVQGNGDCIDHGINFTSGASASQADFWHARTSSATIINGQTLLSLDASNNPQFTFTGVPDAQNAMFNSYGLRIPEVASPIAGTAGAALCSASSSLHALMCNYNGGTLSQVLLGVNPMTTNVIPKAQGNGSPLALSSITDNGTTVSTTEPISATTGFQIAGAATSSHYLRGNGTNYVDSALLTADLPNQIKGATYVTTTNCLLGGATGTTSPAACVAAPAGKVAIPASQTTYTINTTAVTANSEVFVQQVSDNSGLPSSPTCSTTVDAPLQSARVAATSFTFTMTSVASVMCYQYWIVN